MIHNRRALTIVRRGMSGACVLALGSVIIWSYASVDDLGGRIVGPPNLIEPAPGPTHGARKSHSRPPSPPKTPLAVPGPVVGPNPTPLPSLSPSAPATPFSNSPTPVENPTKTAKLLSTARPTRAEGGHQHPKQETHQRSQPGHSPGGVPGVRGARRGREVTPPQ